MFILCLAILARARGPTRGGSRSGVVFSPRSKKKKETGLCAKQLERGEMGEVGCFGE